MLTLKRSHALVLTWLGSWLIAAAGLEWWLWHHHYPLISFWIATDAANYFPFTFASGVTMGHFFGQQFKVPRRWDFLVWCVLMCIFYVTMPVVLFIFEAGVFAGHQAWQMVSYNKAVLRRQQEERLTKA